MSQSETAPTPTPSKKQDNGNIWKITTLVTTIIAICGGICLAEFRVVLPDKSNPLPRMNYWLKTIDRTKLELLSLDEFENTILFHPFL